MVYGVEHRTFDRATFFQTAFNTGEEFNQVFSRTISTRVEGFDLLVKRISGTGSYQFVSLNQKQYTFNGKFLYDGRAVSSGLAQFKRDGSESCWEGKCAPATDASGLLFNPLLWGEPPARLAIGTRWHTPISIPWELGPRGEEDVTVTALDATTGTITLLRQGRGVGVFDNDAAQVKLQKDGKEFVLESRPGAATWNGYTIISRGVILSDELLVERELILASKELGALPATQRQYILLSQMPKPSSWN